MAGIIRVIKGPAPLHDPISCGGIQIGAGFKRTQHKPKQY